MIPDVRQGLLPSQGGKNQQKIAFLVKTNYCLAALIAGSSLSILLLTFLCSSRFYLRIEFGLGQSLFGIAIGGILAYITWKKGETSTLVYSISSAIMALAFETLFILFIVLYFKNNDNQSQIHIEGRDVIMEGVFTGIQSLGMLMSVFISMKIRDCSKKSKDLKTIENTNDYLINQTNMVASSPDLPIQQQILQSDKSKSQQLSSDSKPAELFENCSQYTDSLIGDIDNSLPNNKKKKGLQSIDVLANTDSDMGQKSQATHSDKNNSASQNAQQHGKYMSLNNNDQIYERDEEQEEDDGDYIHNKKLTPCYQQHESDSPENQKIFSVQSETIKSGYASLQGRSYYKTTIDPTHP